MLAADTFALGLFKHDAERPPAAWMDHGYKFGLALFSEIGVQPTYYHFTQVGRGDAKMSKFGGAKYRRELDCGFGQTAGFSLTANPLKSTSPAYDSYLSLGYSHLDYGVPNDLHYLNWTELRFEFDQGVLALNADRISSLVEKMALVQSWDFGFGFSAPREKGPALYLMGASSGRLSKEEQRRLEAWYESPHRERLSKLRDVYAYNLLSPKQLDFELGAVGTLRDFVASNKFSNLTDIGTHLELWTVEPGRTEDVRRELLGTGILITE